MECTWLTFIWRASSVSNSRSLSSHEPLPGSFSFVSLSVSENSNSSPPSPTSASLSSSNSLMFISGMRKRRVDLRDSFPRRVVTRRGSLRSVDEAVLLVCKCAAAELRRATFWMVLWDRDELDEVLDDITDECLLTDTALSWSESMPLTLNVFGSPWTPAGGVTSSGTANKIMRSHENA